MKFRKTSKGGGGPFQFKNQCCRFWTFISDVFQKKLRYGNFPKMRARSKSVWKSTENSFVLVAWPVPKYLHIYGPLDLRSQKPTWPYNRHHLDWEFGAWLVKVGMNTLVGMVRRGMDTLVQSHPLFQALFAARHRGQGLSTSLYSATKYIIYTGISWPFSVGKRQRENTENKRSF